MYVCSGICHRTSYLWGSPSSPCDSTSLAESDICACTSPTIGAGVDPCACRHCANPAIPLVGLPRLLMGRLSAAVMSLGMSSRLASATCRRRSNASGECTVDANPQVGDGRRGCASCLDDGVGSPPATEGSCLATRLFSKQNTPPPRRTCGTTAASDPTLDSKLSSPTAATRLAAACVGTRRDGGAAHGWTRIFAPVVFATSCSDGTPYSCFAVDRLRGLASLLSGRRRWCLFARRGGDTLREPW